MVSSPVTILERIDAKFARAVRGNEVLGFRSRMWIDAKDLQPAWKEYKARLLIAQAGLDEFTKLDSVTMNLFLSYAGVDIPLTQSEKDYRHATLQKIKA